MNEFMREASELAAENLTANSGGPFGAVVVKDIPPYCVAAGVPANPIKSRWNVEEILEHESILYPESERFSKTQIESFSVF